MWMSHLKQTFEHNNKDLRCLEPESKAPKNTGNRITISKKIENLILRIGDDSLNVWGKKKISETLRIEHKISVSPNTVNKYLHKRKRICPKLSLKKKNTFHFYSNRSAPTDNPRVERSRLTGDAEFYSRGGNVADNLQKQKEITQRREDFYNFKRRHQALAYLTPMEFYVLWKKNPAEAYTITAKWQEYLKKQRLRLATSGRIKKKEQIETLMKFIDAKLKHKKEEVEDAKNQLINCKLCSVA